MDILTRLYDLWDILSPSIQTVQEAWRKLPDEIASSMAGISDATMRDISLVALTLLTVAVLNLIYLIIKPKRRRARMTREERRLYERRVISDAITEAVEDLIHKEIITRNTAQHWYFLIGHRCGLTELFPKPLPKPTPRPAADVKAEIKDRLINYFKTKKPLPTPTVKPVQSKTLTFSRPTPAMQLKGA